MRFIFIFMLFVIDVHLHYSIIHFYSGIVNFISAEFRVY